MTRPRAVELGLGLLVVALTIATLAILGTVVWGPRTRIARRR